MKIWIQVEVELFKCHLGPSDVDAGATHYYGFSLPGLVSPAGNPIILRMPEYQYPGNKIMREFVNSQVRCDDAPTKD